MRRIYIAADGGGTKLELGAVSQSGDRLCTVRVDRGINRTTNGDGNIKQTVSEALGLLKDRLGELEALGIYGYFMHNTEIFSQAAGCEATELDEGTLGLYAAGIYGDGVLILSGTGADAYVIKDGKTVDIMGGYGAILGDNGSGFAIGRDAINAAIAYKEGRGEKTVLYELLRAKYKADTFRECVYGIYRAENSVREVAGFCRECEQAADAGDKTAVGIFKKAAEELAAFAFAGYRQYGLEKNTPYTFSGGVISHDIKREKPLMLPYIRQRLAENGIKELRLPLTTPLGGAVNWIKRNKLGFT